MPNRSKIALIIVAILIVIAWVNPVEKPEDTIAPQHETWPGEQDGMEGIDKEGHLTSHLPILVLKTRGQQVPGQLREDKSRLLFEYEVISNEEGLNHSYDSPLQKGKALLSIRGNSSRDFPKKQYLMKTVNMGGEPQDVSILGLPSHDTWVLNGSYIDYSQLRNYIIYNITSEIMDYAPRSMLCEVMMEDEKGELHYEGVYTFIEKPVVSKNRLELTKYNNKYENSSFLLQMNSPIEKMEVEHLLISGTLTYSYDLEYPKTEELTQQSFDFIQNEIYTLEKQLFDAANRNHWETVENSINMDSFIDYYLINEFFQNYDAGRRSTYMYKDVGGKFEMGPVWDFDGAFNNYIDVDFPESELRMRRQHYFYYLMQDPHFVQKCVIRYEELRESTLSEEYLLNYIEEASAYLGDAAIRNCDRWYEGDESKYYDDIEKMKQFVIDRGRWLDDNLEELYTVIE